jgi:cytochrome c peroxidase
MLTYGAKRHRTTFLAALLLLSYIFVVVAARAVEEDADVGIPPALAPGQAPPLPKPGPLAEPRLSTQVGFPTVLTNYVISPSTLRPARVALGQKLFFEPRLSGDGTVTCATCHDPARAFTDGRPVSVGIMAASANATPQPCRMRSITRRSSGTAESIR